MSSSSEEYKPRLSIELSQRDYDEIRQLIPHGVRGHVFRKMVGTLMHLLRKNPDHRRFIIAAVLSGELDLATATYEGALNDGPATSPNCGQ